MKMNINDYALVQLTEDGVAQHTVYYKSIGLTEQDATNALRHTSVENGRHRFHIWELMQKFGDQMYNGNAKQMFTENIIEFVRS